MMRGSGDFYWVIVGITQNDGIAIAVTQIGMRFASDGWCEGSGHKERWIEDHVPLEALKGVGRLCLFNIMRSG